jgi:Holliday junction DNA helicase RuvA
MYNYISGEVVNKTEGMAVIENNGIGYEIRVSMNTLDALPCIGEIAKIYTFLNVREDEMSLYGFATLEEKEMFLKLTEVSGIGPKGALSILSGVRLSDLAVAIKTEDLKLLSTIKGIGKKTAERIIVELKDKIDLIGYSAVRNEEEQCLNSSAIDEATEALISLGVNKNEAYRLARENAKNNDKAEDIVRKVFQNLNA